MRIRTLVLGGSLVMGAAVPGGTLAVSPARVAAATPADTSAFTLEASLWRCELSGGGVGSDAQLAITLRRASGTRIATKTEDATLLGSWTASFCDKGAAGKIRPGDRITIKKGAEQKTFTVPDALPRVNVPANVVVVPRPAGITDAEITVFPCTAGAFCDFGMVFDPSGTPYRVDTDPTDIQSGDVVQVELLIDAGIQRYIATAPAPYLAVRNGSPKVTGTGRPGAKVTITVRRSDGTVRGTATGKANGPNGAFALTVRKNGKAVKVRPGDRVRASIYDGAQVRTVAGSLTIDTGTGLVSGTCFPDTDVLIHVWNESADGSTTRPTDAAGDFTLDAAGLGLPIPSGTQIRARCENGQGNQQLLSHTVP